ncbi:MAG: TraC family protein, partial [Sulfuricella sp.]
MPRSLIERFVALPRLTGILPYVGWLADERMFVLDQGGFGATEQFSIGFAIEVAPQTGATDEMEKILASLFISCPAETGIQVSLYASPDINRTLQAQTALIKNAELIDIAERRNKYYQSGTGKSLLANNSYLLRNFRCVISISLPLSPFAPTEVEEAIRTRESIHATLRSAYLDGFDWTPDHLLNFVGDFFDHERVFNSDAR